MLMNIGKVKLYCLEILLLASLVFTLFVSNIYKTIYLSIFLFIYMFIIKKIIKKRNIISYMKNEVTILMIIFGIIYLIVFYLLGIYFGFYKSTVLFGITSIIYFIIPLSLIIYSTEVMREIFLGQKDKISKILTFISIVLIDLIIYTEVYDINKLDDFLTILGFIFFASVSCNLLYNYISKRFGKNGIIAFRLITVLYPYIIPYTPDVYIFLRSFLRIIYPYFIYLFLEKTYSKSNFAVSYKDRRKEIISTSMLFIVLTSVVMLVSCEFKYGIIVIGSSSMTGTLNMGDATIYEEYNGQKLLKGDIIIFNKDNLQIIHRIIDIKNINGQIRYYTKGDANKDEDNWYLTDDNIKGISRLRIKYIGYPTLFVNELFS